MKTKKFPNWLIVLSLFVLALVFRLWGLNAQGQTWDEIAYYDGGKSYIRNVYHLEFKSSAWRQNFEHPPVAKWIYGIADIPTYKENLSFDKFTAGRAASAAMGALTVVILYLLSLRMFKSRKTALASSLILCFLPYFVAHNKVLGLETPSALFYTLSVYLFYRGLTEKGKYYIYAGLAAGFALGTRVNNGHVLLFMGLSAIVFYLFFAKQRKQKFSHLIWTIPFIALALVFALWPWLWQDTINHFGQNISFWKMQMAGQKSGAVTTWFLKANVVPGKTFYLYYFLATAPPAILALILTFIYQTIRKLDFEKIYLWLWFLTFLAMSFIGFKQDGLRYVYPILVPTAAIAGYSVTNLFKNKILTIIASVFVVLSLITSCIMIHPYYLDYYSEFLGGTKGVSQSRNFAVGWWGEGLDASFQVVNQSAKDNDKVLSLVFPDYSNEKLESSLLLTNYEQLKKMQGVHDFDFIITNPSFYWNRTLNLSQISWADYSVFKEIEANGASIATIYRHN